MVEENFKVGLKFELDVESLETIARQVERQIDAAIARGTKAAGGKGALPGGAGTAKSIKQTLEVRGDDFVRDVKRAIAGEFAGFESTLKQHTDALNKLSRVMERSNRPASTGPVDNPTDRRVSSRARALPRVERQINEQTRQLQSPEQGLSSEGINNKLTKKLTRLEKGRVRLIQDNLRDSRKLEDAQDELAKSIKDEAAAHREAAKKIRATPTGSGVVVSGPVKGPAREQLAQKQVGPSNIHRGANIEATRAAGSERTAGGAGGVGKSILADAPRVRDGRVGTREDSPNFKRNQDKSMAARDRSSGMEKGAEFRVDSINRALTQLRETIARMPGLRGMDPKELFAKLNLPAEAQVGTGAAPQIKDFAGNVKVVAGTIEMFGGKLEKLSTVVNERIKVLTAKGGILEEISRTARRDPEMAVSRLRKEIKGVFESSASIQTEGRPRQGFQKGGEFMLRYTPTDEEKERLSALRNEAEIIGEVNKAIYQYIQNNEELRNSLRKAGIEGAFSTGLGDKPASDIRITRGEKMPGKPAPIEQIEMPVQTRQLATVGIGGEGGLARWAREFLVTQMSDIEGGVSPSIKGSMEKQLEEAGMILKGGFKEFKTVLADPDIIPEIREDQFLFDPKVVKMNMRETKSTIVRTPAEGLAPGQKLERGQVVGTRGEGEDLEHVKLNFTGSEATVERLERVMIDGIEGVKIVYKELNQMISGSKLMDRSGIKGIGKAADLEKMGFEPGTGVVMSMEGLAKRHGLRTGVEMQAHGIAEATGSDPQEIAEHIEASMESGGKSIAEAVREAAKAFGAENFKGTMKMGGPLAEAAGGNLEFMTGKMAWARAPREGETGPIKTKLRYIDPSAMTTMGARSESAGMVEQWRKNMAAATQEHGSLVQALKAFRGELDLTGSNMRTVRAEDLKRLPAGAGTSESFKGTLLDPELASAFAMSIPSKEGGNKLMYVPQQGGGLGERGSFTTKVGTKGATGVATMLDKIAEQATKIRGLRGELPLEAGSDAMKEAAEVASKAIKVEVAAIKELGIASAEGAERARKFLGSLMPVIDAMQGPVGLKYQRLGAGDKPAGPVQEVKATASEYVGRMKGMSKLYAVQDVLAERAGTTGGAAGNRTQSIAQLGKVHDNTEVLNQVMQALNITLDGTGEAAERAFEYLNKLEENLFGKFVEMGRRRAKPEKEEKRSIAAAAEGGVSFAPMGTALQFRTDVSKELERVSEYLTQMAASGQDVGEAAAAFQRISSAQKVDLPSIDRDTILINESDFKKLVATFSKRLDIDPEEATRRLSRPGMAQRYPITGEQSFMAARLKPVSSDILPQGKLGVSGTMAVSSNTDLAKMLGPLEKLESELLETAAAANFTGPAAEEAGNQLRQLSPILDKLRMQFLATGLNLDFDGDKIAFHADMMTKAGSDVKTFCDSVSSCSVSFQKAFTTAISSVKGPGGPSTNLDELEKMFKSGKAKGRPEAFMAAKSWPTSPERAQFEAAAHTGPKRSIGKLSDLFNQVALAVHAGGEKMGDALNTFVGQLLLGINESMASKHGSGGAKGPLEFLESLRKGQLGEITTAMKAGEGFFGKLAKQNDQMLSHMKKDLQRLAASQGPEGLMQFVEKSGLGVKIKPQDMAGSINDIIKSAGIDNMISTLFETLKRSMISSLVKGGHTLEEAQSSVQNMLSPSSKGGFIKGLDLRKAVETGTPGYAMTRNKGQAEIKELPLGEQAGKVLNLMPHKIAQDTELEDVGDAKEMAKGVRDKIKAWMREILGGMHGEVRPISAADIAGGGIREQSRGAFTRGKETQGGAEGSIKYNPKFIESTKASLETLGNIIEGNLTNIDATSLINLTKNMREFMGVIAHEGVHKANKAWADGVNTITQELMSGSGELGKYAKQVLEVMKGHAGIRKLMDELMRLRDLKKSGATEAKVSGRVQDPKTGQWGRGRKTLPIGGAIKHGETELVKGLSEEMMAYSVQPERGAGFMDRLPQAVREFVDEQVDRLKKNAGPEGDIMRKTIEAREEITNGILGGLMQAVGGLGPPDLKGQASKMTAALGEFPDASRFNRALELLGAHERTIVESGSAFGGMSDIRQAAEGGLQRMEEPKALRLGGRADLESISAKIKGLNEGIGEAITDPELLQGLTKQVQGTASSARSKIGVLRKDPTIAKQFGGVTGQEEYLNIMREFQRNVATAFAQKARDLQRQITEMRQLGKEQTPEFGPLVDKFVDTVTRLQNWASETLAARGGGRGTLASYVAHPKGELLPSAMQAGVTPTKSTFEAVMSSTAGQGAEGSDFLKRLRPSIEGAVSALQEGEDPLKTWNKLFQNMLQYPETFSADIVKIVEILKKFSRLIGISTGEFSTMAQNLQKVAGTANEAAKATKNLRAPNAAGIVGALTGGTKAQRGAGAGGMGGGFEDSINAQYEEMRKQMAERQAKLQKLIQTKGYKSTGEAGRHFEGQNFEIIDPDSGKVMQKYATDFVRHGDNIRSSLKQIGTASKGTREMLQTAFRRVVQWGFASGIIYGTMRAFRALTSVVVTVETKMTELKKVMDTSTTNFHDLQDAASGMAMSFGIAIEDVLDGMVVYAQQGLKMNEITERTRATLLATTVTTLKTEEATEALTSVMKVFGNEVASSEHAVDAWAAVAAKHAIGAKELAQAVQRAGSAAKVAGVSFEDFMGITTAIGSVTRQSGKELATGEKFMFRTIRTPKAQKELNRIGVNSQDQAGNFRPVMDILGEVSSKWDTLTQAQKLNMSESIAGIRHYNQFLVLMDNWSEVLEASSNAQNSQGYATQKAAIATQTFAKQMQMLKESVKRLAMDIGKSLLPAMTTLVSWTQKVFNVINMIPDRIKTAGVAAAAGFLTMHKAADLTLDTFEMLAGSNVAKKIKEVGLVGSAKGLFGKAGGAKGAITGLESLGDAAQGTNALTRGLMGVKTAFVEAATAGKLFTASNILLVAAAAGLFAIWKSLPASGADVSASLDGQIGKAMEAADSYRKMGTEITKLGSMRQKALAEMKKTSTAEGLNEAFRTGNFKGPATLAKGYTDALSEAGQSLGEFDPGILTGVDEYGGLVMGVGESYKYAAASAGDFQKAQAAALQTRVLKAYASEINEANTMWRKSKEIIADVADWVGEVVGLGKGVGDSFFDTSLAEEYKSATREVEKLIQQRQELADSGSSILSNEQELADAIAAQLSLREQVLQKSQELKKVLEQMPTFEDLDLAEATLGPETAKAIAPGVQAGAFGKGATVGSVMMKQLSKSAGIGGMFDYTTLASPARTMEGFLQKGITPTVGKDMFSSVKATGDVAQVSREAAAKMLGLQSAAPGQGKAVDEALNTAQTGIASLDKETGKATIRFYNNLTNEYINLNEDMWTQLRGSLSEEGQKTGVFGKQVMEDAMETTRRILTLQFTGAMAGIRQPAGAEIGPGRFLEVGAEQRMAGDLPDQLQRLSDIQGEMSNYIRNINEDLDPEAMKEGSQQIDALTESTLKMISDLQQEGFKISVIANYNKALQDLQITMEQASDASKKLEAREQARFKTDVYTSGDLAGKGKMAELEFGPASRDLTAFQRLQSRMGAPFENAVEKMAIQDKQRANMVETAGSVAEKQVDFKSMIKELRERGQVLNKELMERLSKQFEKGLDPGQREFVNAIWDSSTELKDLGKQQVDVQQEILDVLKATAEISAAGSPEEKKGKLQDYLHERIGEETLGPLRDSLNRLAEKGVVPSNTMENMRRQMLGITQTGEQSTIGGKAKSYGRGAGTLDMSKVAEADRPAVEEGIRKIIDLENQLSAAQMSSNSTVGKAMGWDVSKDIKGSELETEWQKLLGVGGVSNQFQDDLRGVLNKAIETKPEAAASAIKGGSKGNLDEQIRFMENQGLKAFSDTIDGVTQVLKENEVASRKAKEAMRISQEIETFAMGIDNLIVDFQKAKALEYEKKGSDLEGAFARVGQPGFRTQFENKRMEIQQQYGNRPMSYDEMQARDKALNDVSFDEQEAKVKEQQDVEVSALREQQSQADRVRTSIADALFSGQLAGSPETESMAKSYMDTLTSQLATSEQAQNKGGQLTFRGIPALEEVGQFAAKLKQQAEAKAKEAQSEIVKKGVEGLQMGIDTQTQVLKSILDVSSKQLASMEKGGPAGALPANIATQALPAQAAIAQSAAAAVGIAPIAPGEIASNPDVASQLLLQGANKDFQNKMQYYANTNGMRGQEQPDLGTPFYPGMYKGEGRKYGRTLSDSFVKEQTFSSPAEKEPELLPEAPEDYMKRVMADYTKRGQKVQTFQPSGGLIPDSVKSGEGPIDLTKYYNGASNYNQISRMQTRQETGNSKLSQGLVASDKGDTPGPAAPGDKAGRTPAGGGDSQSEALQKIAESLDATKELISNLTTNFQLPADLSSQIENVGTTIADRLGETITVEIANTPVPVAVDGLADAFSSALDSSGISSVGADVSDALGRLSVLESIVDPQGASVEELISQATADLNQTIDQTNIDLNTQIERIDTLEEEIADIPDVSDLEIRFSNVEDVVNDLEPRVDTLEEGIADFQSGLNTFGGRIDSLENISSELADSFGSVEQEFIALSTQVEEFGTQIGDFDDRISAAETAATAASDAVADIRTGLNTLQTTVEQNKQNAQTSVRDAETQIAKADQQIQSIQQTINTLQRKAETALSVAQQAINRANQKT